jgi:hypothetical protein
MQNQLNNWVKRHAKHRFVPAFSPECIDFLENISCTENIKVINLDLSVVIVYLKLYCTQNMEYVD